MNPNMWLRHATARMGPLPESYLAFDVETSGLSVREDYVIQIGWALVQDRKMIDTGAVMLDWTRGNGDGWKEWFTQRLQRTRDHVEYKDGFATGNTFDMTVERIQREGMSPYDALLQFKRLVDTCRDTGFAFVGHNGLRHDQPMLDKHFQEVLDARLVFCPGEYYDTLPLEKGVQLYPAIKPGETWMQFITRGYHLGGNKIRCSLDRHCAGKYNLQQKHNLDMSLAHEADFDARLTHLLFEEFREIMGGGGRSAA